MSTTTHATALPIGLEQIGGLFDRAVTGITRSIENVPTVTFPTEFYFAMQGAVRSALKTPIQEKLYWLLGDGPSMHIHTARNLAIELGRNPDAIGLAFSPLSNS